jgi:hypothetical protein
LSLVISGKRIYVAANNPARKGELNVVLVIALEIRDLFGAAWKAYRAGRVVRSRRRSVPEARRSHLPKGFAPSS